MNGKKGFILCDCQGTCPSFTKMDISGVLSDVRNPYNCVVECSTCGRLCPSESISFPDQKAFTGIIGTLIEEYRR